ncbi:3-oxo-tetronate kinase [Litoreibacter roseus]|uniref:3-oxo-tetronate kinase n=1 Tax=Litoreibacter roseus TaxID=2601869 RepID=A0A6N6JJK7_9RHOB|nr:3-oxo-tetronate kinase [Litoreibacter roseus]GFE66511.1 HPr kinase [Litoreibacter roseus]
MLLGCIGDDFTGSSDLANTLAKGGMKTVQYTGVPNNPAAADVEAGVVALKSRSIEPVDAVAQSLAALEWLKNQGCEQFFFKYCSTFDSTPDGNIGPVADALADALDAHKIIVCPAFPGTGRAIFQGHLFVNDTLLSESGMEHHPLTPMTDPDIRRWLARQTSQSVGHVSTSSVFDGAAAIADALEREHSAGHRYIVVDAIRDADLIEIGKATQDLPLITGGSGVALGLPANYADRLKAPKNGPAWRAQDGPCIALSGSCSQTTRSQVDKHKTNHPSIEITAEDALSGTVTAEQLSSQLLDAGHLALAYSSADPAVVARAQADYGRENVATALEGLFANTAKRLVASGVTKLLIAGGETSGAVVEALHPEALEIGPEIDPGVPALRARDDLALVLKSGNFGAPDFFVKANRILEGGS